MNYKDKYLKYKIKYLYRKKFQKSFDFSYIISLLWFNKSKGPIKQFSKDGEDLNIREKIIETYNMFKIKYKNPKVILFLNYDKIVSDDLCYFKQNNIETQDINQFEVIKSNEKLTQLFNWEKYDRSACPVYVYIDMLKILIQYEYMFYKNYDYVVFSDIDIQYKDNIKTDTICGPSNRPGYIDKFFPNKIFNRSTLGLLDVFGYMMAGFSKLIKISDMSRERDKKYAVQQINNEIEQYSFTPSFINIDGEYYVKVDAITAENSFLISKNNPQVIKAIKKYFIDFLFCEYIFNNPNQTNNFIFYQYITFNGYLNFLQGINTLDYNDDDEKILNKLIDKSFLQNKDFTIGGNKIITILSENCLDYLIEQYNFPILFNTNGLRDDKFNYYSRKNITEHGKDIYKKYYIYIQPSLYCLPGHSENHIPLSAFKCVPIDRQKNS
jgi:hypothetical protein